MLVSNLDIEQRFANGTQGRILYWNPGKVQKKKAISAAYPELTCRFAKEASFTKPEMLRSSRALTRLPIPHPVAQRARNPEKYVSSDIDFLDVTPRQETMQTVPGQPVQIQLSFVPSYALTVHKTQAMSGSQALPVQTYVC